MKRLKLFTGNRLENLADLLAGVIATPLPCPLAEEIIIVQSRGMERWVSLQLAGRLGVCANCRFPFPNAFMHEIFRKIMPDLPEKTIFDPEFLTWKIIKLLPACVHLPAFESLQRYLEGAEQDLKLLQLAGRIADVFDQYLLFRPEMIFRWETGKEKHWQAILWNELVRDNYKTHRAAVGQRFMEILARSGPLQADFPERISVFGISSLPRLHLQVLDALAQFAAVNLFLVNPCREFWGDILSDWEMHKVSGQTRALASLPLAEKQDALHMDQANSLLASMGMLGRDFFDLIRDIDCEEIDSFQDPGDDTLLHCLQSDILHFRNRSLTQNDKRVISGRDTSIQVHSCHGPMREMEVLYDRILDMLETDAALAARDILVMTPDIEAYAPYIQAVFDTADDTKKIPFSIADRSVRHENRIVDMFFEVLDLHGSRFGAAQVLSLLESRAVRTRFDLSGDDLARVTQWVQDIRIRWGVDGQSREALGLPAFSENTWQEGIDRLLLGFALPGKNERMFAGMLPYDDIEGREAEVLGNFIAFVTGLITRVKSLAPKRRLGQWAQDLSELVARFFPSDRETEAEIQILQNAFHGLQDIERVAGFDQEVEFPTIRSYLRQNLEKVSGRHGFLSGGVTFCSILPMRSIPFKIICLVGMDGDAYPRQSKNVGFDLLSQFPQKGDRSRRHDDRYLFLEALLSARQRLYISYVGQDIQDNSPIPPSVLVSEISDVIDQEFVMREKKILDHIHTRHRLQAFSPLYFQPDGGTGRQALFSYSRQNLLAAQGMLRPGRAAKFFSGELGAPEDEYKRLDLDTLCAFFRHPIKFLLHRRLGLFLEENSAVLEEKESFDIDPLGKYALAQELVEMKLSGKDAGGFFVRRKAAGQLPPGTVGKCLFDGLRQQAEAFADNTAGYLQGPEKPAIQFSLELSGFQVSGKIDAVFSQRRVRYRYAKIKPKDRLAAWLCHLVMNCIRQDGMPKTSLLLGLDPDKKDAGSAWEFVPLDNSEQVLSGLLEIYWQGLCRPLCFFPAASWKYAQLVLEKNKSCEDALQGARDTWTGNEFVPGEMNDLYYDRCFYNMDPLDGEFGRLALTVFAPLMANQKRAQAPAD
ncbi:MAG: exodeoxyribonuclease V subunit gamma [Desulfobacterales bacterium]|nr:exodeoxyribonuclease V subunit gamma [Desulfobacterales bacterium]